MKSDFIVDELEKIRESMKDEEPLTQNTMNSLLNLLQYAFCPHEFETMRSGATPDGPLSIYALVVEAEYVTVCKKCGCEKMEESDDRRRP